MIATTLMAHDTNASMPNNLEVKSTFLSPKKKNRNGFAGKRITEFNHTLGVKLCQRESTYFDATGCRMVSSDEAMRRYVSLDSSMRSHDKNEYKPTGKLPWQIYSKSTPALLPSVKAPAR
jgi:hypothetical protein